MVRRAIDITAIPDSKWWKRERWESRAVRLTARRDDSLTARVAPTERGRSFDLSSCDRPRSH